MRIIAVSVLIGFFIGTYVADLDKDRNCKKRYIAMANEIINARCEQDVTLQVNTKNATHKLVCADLNIGEGCVLNSVEKKSIK